MITPQTPGVYRQNVFPAPPAGLATGVPVFLGLASEGETNVPRRLTRLAQLSEAFGAPRPGSHLAAAVEGFFANGGQECLVVRLAEGGDSLQGGLAAIRPRQDLDLVCAPDVFANGLETGLRLQSEILAHCDAAGDRIALLDSVPGSGVLDQRRSLSGTNGALYHPWVRPRLDGPFVPPCGHVAGLVARSDRNIGVHKAPANEALDGVVELAANVSDVEQAALNPEGINVLRAFPGRGIRVWGARTLSREAAWAYVNVRRLFLTVVRWIERNLAGTAFEPNDARLWNRLTREITAYLSRLFQAGALQGRTPAEAFFVRCDAETNPPEEREAGRVVTLLGLAPLAPSEFVVVRIVTG